MPISDLFSFLGSGERKILGGVISLLDLSIESSQHLLSLVMQLKIRDYEAVDKEFETISNLESQADDERRNLVRVLCTGSFFGGIREDLLNLLDLIGNISHSAKHSAMVFHDSKLPKEVIDYFFQEDVASFITTCTSASQLLKTAIQALETNKGEVLSIAEKVEEKEAQADEIHHSIVRHLYKNEINAKSLDIVELTDFLHLADDIADNAENGSDVLQILVAKGYS